MDELKAEDSDLAAREAQIRRTIDERRAAERAARAAATQTTSSNSTTAVASTSSSGQTFSGNVGTVINAGNRYIGNSVYVFGGGRNAYDIANGRFDCSAFTRWAFSQAGITLGYNTDAQARQGRQVPASEMRPGDLVFFDTYKRNGHVGIYIGNGQFIGSQSSTGVAIASMNNSYYKRTFKGHVRRIIE
nr:C40 family peptidase [Evansella tamaricis]